MLVIIGVVIGVVLGLVTQPTIPAGLQPYLPIAVVAALDAMFGALRAYIEDSFSDRVFITSLLFTTTPPAFILSLSDQPGVV